MSASRRLQRRTAAIAAIAVLPLAALAGCSKDEAKSPAASSSMGPLEEFLSSAYGEYDEDKANEDSRRSEEIIAECMADQGFDYTPVDYSSQNAGMSIDVDTEDPKQQWGTIEFAKAWGYGMTTNPYGDQMTEEPTDGETWTDPNQAYVDAMSETEQQAYWAALYGDQTATDGEEMTEWDWSTAGCSGKAQHEVYDQGNVWNDDKFQALQEEMNKVWEQAQNDPRIAEVTATWVDCMADAGYDGLATVDDAQNQFNEKVNAIYEDAWGDGTAEVSEQDAEEIQKQIEAKLADLTSEEIETATADFTCREKVKFDDVQREVQWKIEQDFVDSHRTELEAFKTALEESQR